MSVHLLHFPVLHSACFSVQQMSSNLSTSCWISVDFVFPVQFPIQLVFFLSSGLVNLLLNWVFTISMFQPFAPFSFSFFLFYLLFSPFFLCLSVLLLSSFSVFQISPWGAWWKQLAADLQTCPAQNPESSECEPQLMQKSHLTVQVLPSHKVYLETVLPVSIVRKSWHIPSHPTINHTSPLILQSQPLWSYNHNPKSQPLWSYSHNPSDPTITTSNHNPCDPTVTIPLILQPQPQITTPLILQS